MTVFLADGGIETALSDRLGQQLPEFAAFVLLDTGPGREALRGYYRPYLELAGRSGAPMVLDTPTWRANPDWIALLGYEAAEIDRINAAAVALVRGIIAETAPRAEVLVNGCVGPRHDDYVAEQRMTAEEAQSYHAPQIAALAAAGADRVTGVTIPDAAEGIGIVRAAEQAGVPVLVSFTVGADGRLPSGSTVASAVSEVDAATGAAPLGYLVNCAHPDEVRRALDSEAGIEASVPGRALAERLLGFRLNAARHGDEGPGDAPEDFARGLLSLADLAPSAQVFGGCCGTDTPHIAAAASMVFGSQSA